MTQQYCCNQLEFFLNENKLCIGYNENYREYYINLKKQNSPIQIISNCPWCGSRFPKDLRDEWFDTLEEEYGIEDPKINDKDRVPEEFKTDEWWKKRGL